MNININNPIIVQSDKTLLVEVNNELYIEVRDKLSRFAEVIKSPEYIHTYKISPISLWNAATSGMSYQDIIEILEKYSKYEVPQNVIKDIEDNINKYGKIKIIREENSLFLISKDLYIMKEITNYKSIEKYFKEKINDFKYKIDENMRGEIKLSLIKLGYPVEDLGGYIEGNRHEMSLKKFTSLGETLSIRDYQKEASEIFYADGSAKGGSGVVVLPCGAGKTVTAMAVMDKIKEETLILTTNITAVRQWKQELIDKMNILEENIGEYSGEIKEIKSITISTYQILTHRKSKVDEFVHMNIFHEKDWGLIIYDEVHTLPAPIFRAAAEIQATRRLGLTATLVREDGKEEDVFSLIGPKKYDMPWKVLEKQGWIAEAQCTEVRVKIPEDLKMEYAVSDSKSKFRIASENYRKIDVLKNLINEHKDDKILIIGQYIEQLNIIAKELKVPIITGKTKNSEREQLFDKFRIGDITILIVSKVANFAIDLPDASVAIQVSGTFGSRQEEAQRLGRILRPKKGDNRAYFYSIVTADSREQEFALKRQLFLAEQGYKYYIELIE
ncbi:DEAD/DEAH box helicase [Clostridium beijerinckii]|uniref:DNA 3'-5' helicase n=1 Tax=Clostridium beijerinckii TaxID=1520 RepID=A0AB74V9S1_CLOBE|nr:DNA repair helicase XPB [Clostridium beijerinckii]NRZ27306.1 DNA excision repair protein ERCC-3 [Clostridium beijerinckii]NYB96901.1 DNA excision repair protein ERCC-3 [Clostridium beijerinckii]OOM27091.1 type III restriction enzyme, res subunit [Clostridium beijerinckii]QUN33157.1 DEAD/DEAH box helicase [Clostridium beijerinckii]SQB11752.1 helicase [Clostridium beijerinckii]